MIKYSKYFIAALLFCSISFAQGINKDKRAGRLNDLKKNYFEGKYKDAMMAYLNFEESLTPEEAYYLGLSNFSLYNYERAIEYFKEAVDKEKENTGYEYQLAKTYQLAGRNTDAENHFNNILSREPNYIPALFDAGALDYSKKKYADAVRKYKKVIKSAPNNFLAFYNLAKSYSGFEPNPAYSDSVEINLSTCVTINAHYLPAVEMLALRHFNNKNYDHARILYIGAFSKNPSSSEYTYMIGLCYEKEGDYEKAIDLYKRAIAINPDQAHYYDHLGFSNYHLGKFAESVAAYKKAVEFEEDNASYHVNLAYSYIKVDSIDRAIESFRIAVVKLRPETIGQVYCQIGHVYYSRQNYKDAKKEYQTALYYDPKNIDALYLGAISDESLKNMPAALTGYKKALELLKDTMPEGELNGNERYNTIKKRIADLSKMNRKVKK